MFSDSNYVFPPTGPVQVAAPWQARDRSLIARVSGAQNDSARESWREKLSGTFSRSPQATRAQHKAADRQVTTRDSRLRVWPVFRVGSPPVQRAMLKTTGRVRPEPPPKMPLLPHAMGLPYRSSRWSSRRHR